jgi:hypothetical protein
MVLSQFAIKVCYYYYAAAILFDANQVRSSEVSLLFLKSLNFLAENFKRQIPSIGLVR